MGIYVIQEYQPYEFSYANLLSAMQEIGCHSWRSFFYLRPGHSIENGLSEITSDADMTKMFVLYEGGHPCAENVDDEEEDSSLSSDCDDLEYVVNEGEGVDGDEGRCLPVSNLEEDLEKGTIGAPRTMGTSATSGRGVARGRGLTVSATIGGASAVGTGGARATSSATFGGARAVQTGYAKIDRDCATRTGGTNKWCKDC
ncbi:hypothetical protein RHSIM_Rhsim02G0152600 [Rhododendron simsii]|uniref:Uncharacterized protein n=1 Tax=Rhododendron simsii TaxID=118357 RepID=A0A834H8N0_RHOSS|nr:hypothetical protein RHSIM_Rhsim02G0152600 [Rhododendron simsii]